MPLPPSKVRRFEPYKILLIFGSVLKWSPGGSFFVFVAFLCMIYGGSRIVATTKVRITSIRYAEEKQRLSLIGNAALLTGGFF